MIIISEGVTPVSQSIVFLRLNDHLVLTFSSDHLSVVFALIIIFGIIEVR